MEYNLEAGITWQFPFYTKREGNTVSIISNKENPINVGDIIYARSYSGWSIYEKEIKNILEKREARVDLKEPATFYLCEV